MTSEGHMRRRCRAHASWPPMRLYESPIPPIDGGRAT